VGPALRTWTVAPAAGRFTATFRVPLDAAFVGFRGSTQTEAAIERITITPLSVVDKGLRAHAPPVLGAAEYGPALVLLHDDWVNPEPTGFWVLGQRPTRLSVAPAAAGGPLTLRLRSGVEENEVTLSTHGWRQVVTLAADAPQDVELPPSERGLVQLTILASSGFVPMDRDPASRDRRFLGVWVEVP
jgi:hypothetical protein